MTNQIICAAIRFTEDGTIIRGHRHDYCLKYAMEIPKLKTYNFAKAEQGFIDAENKFVTRLEAMDIQIAAGIPSFDGHELKSGYILFSEDLY